MTENPAIAELERSIVDLSQAYYTGEAVVSDEEFDSRVDHLRSLDPDNPILKQVGWGLKVYGNKIKLPAPILETLPKIKSADLSRKYGTLVSPKIDGMSVTLEYDHGKLVTAATRGDGVYGVDITPKMPYIKTDVVNVSPEVHGVYRGELFIPLSIFSSESTGYSNPRNGVAGIINSKSFDNLHLVHFASHGAEPGSGVMPHPVEFLNLEDFTQEEMNFIRDYISVMRHYPIDGLVIGADEKTPTVAFKFDSQNKDAVIHYIEWNLSYNRQLVPVAILRKSLDLYGTQVNRVTCIHAEYVEINSLGPGAHVSVTKANEIIPQITEVISGSNYCTIPDECPECGSTLIRSGTGLFCNSRVCMDTASVKSFINQYYTTKGATDVDTIYSCLISSGEDPWLTLFYLAPDQVYDLLVDKMGPVRSTRIAELFSASRFLDASDFLLALGLRNVGEVLSSRAAGCLDLIERDPHSFCVAIKAPSHAYDAILNRWNIVQEAYRVFKDKLIGTDPGPVIDQLIVLSGKFSVKKSVIEEELAKKGIGCSSSVTSDIEYVVSSNPDSNKTKKAVRLGIKVITEEELIRLFNLDIDNGHSN